MLIGHGVDIVEIERIRRSVERYGERFLKRVFTASEIKYCRSKRDPYPSFSARFAAKEAVIKALPSTRGVPLTDIEVAIVKSKPVLKPGPTLRKVMKKAGVSSVHLSLSHERHYAVASVITL